VIMEKCSWKIQLVEPTEEQQLLHRNFVVQLETTNSLKSPNFSFSSEKKNNKANDCGFAFNQRRQRKDDGNVINRPSDLDLTSQSRLHNILSSIHDDEILETEIFTAHHSELNTVLSQQELYRQQTTKSLQNEANIFLHAQQQQDEADEQILGSFSTVEECNEYEIQLKKKIEETRDSTPVDMRRYNHVLGKLEFKKMEIQDRAEATAAVNAVQVKNDEIEVKRIKMRFAKYMKRLLKSANKEEKRYKSVMHHDLEKNRRERMEILKKEHEMEHRKLHHAHESEIRDIQERLDLKRDELAVQTTDAETSDVELNERQWRK